MGPASQYLVQHILAPENSSVSQDKAINSVDFLYLKKEAGQPQFILDLHKGSDNFNKLSKFGLRHAIEVANKCIQVSPQ